LETKNAVPDPIDNGAELESVRQFGAALRNWGGVIETRQFVGSQVLERNLNNKR